MIESIIIFMYPSLTLLRGPLGFLEKEPRLAWPSHLSLLILLAWDIRPSFVKRMSGQDIMKAWLSLLFHLQTYFLKCIPTRNPSQLHPSENNSLRLWGLPPPLPLTLIACKPAVVGSEKSELSVLGAQFPAASTTWKRMTLLFQTQGKTVPLRVQNQKAFVPFSCLFPCRAGFVCSFVPVTKEVEFKLPAEILPFFSILYNDNFKLNYQSI